ncbi:MAG: FAD-dependent oxidoreductase, partial [Pseudomonadota bacterium]
MSKIGVIGSGFGGLAAACTLAARGHQVTVLEKNEWIGGKAAVLETEGYRFDMGPTILTVPRVLERIFGEANISMEEELDLVRLDPQWRCFFDDGSVLDLHEKSDAMRTALSALTNDPNTAAGYEDFMKLSERLHEVSDKFFFWRTVEGLRDTINIGESMSLSTLSDVLSLRMGATVAGTVRRRVR